MVCIFWVKVVVCLRFVFFGILIKICNLFLLLNGNSFKGIVCIMGNMVFVINKVNVVYRMSLVWFLDLSNGDNMCLYKLCGLVFSCMLLLIGVFSNFMVNYGVIKNVIMVEIIILIGILNVIGVMYGFIMLVINVSGINVIIMVNVDINSVIWILFMVLIMFCFLLFFFVKKWFMLFIFVIGLLINKFKESISVNSVIWLIV